MASSSRRAVITGLGVLSPVGLGQEAYWQGLLAGRSGIRTISAFDTSSLPTHIGGEIPDFDAKQFIRKEDRKSLRVMARAIQLAVCAAQLALDDSKIDKGRLDPTRFGVEFGAGLIATDLEEIAEAARVSSNCVPGVVDLEKWGEQGMANIQPLWMLKYLPNMLACHVSILHNAQGPSNTITESEVASLLALGEAYRIIGRDWADFFLVGGADSRLNPLSLTRNCLFQPLSRRNDEPARASRPFDRDRDGMVLGEGATVVALESLEHAQRRGARILAELVGFGSACDIRRDGTGVARAIRTALAQAGIAANDLDHVNAHGLSAVESDIWEARGLLQVWGGGRSIPVFAPKSYMGNLGAGCGLTETAASILGLQHGLVPPTLNYEKADPACPLPIIAGQPRPVERPWFLKVSFTDMGQCAAAVFRRWDGE
jgi:3-oxoacyl-[acyl-carrier-protein] synthase II